ncbi:SDR family oxidoreductase [Sphingomonas qomolangmaensis]|uniref:SDR family oxidoreductase n=1 Tax=Sphingomonas qomolangmaensis TaxID=2918765 RepID=A0ABY5L6T9_9SPHN|nr:SDR family oxidoreductase [Sphingomonas qomolangmaensis]UUL81318.1 SDR family oxidoreductase [Sphingomonas qomolangmaensis]
MSDIDTSRRTFVVGAGLATAAAGASPALAQEAANAVGAPTTPAAAAYPKPPFPPQRQPWPGLASKMTPRPDHGETSYKGSGKLTGKRALITGGDSGIGRAAAIAYAREGADVAINYLPAEEPDAREVIALIRAEGRRAVAIPGDLRDEGFCRKLVEQAARELGGLDILVNNAARQQTKPAIADISSADFDATMKTNVYAPFWLTKAAVARMTAGAVIVNTSSEQASDPSEDLVDYALTRAAVLNFTKSMAKQLVSKGIRVNAVAPGPFWTPLQVSGGATQEKLQAFGSTSPMGRPGQPAEIAALFVAAADPSLSYSTGQVFGSTGGGGQPA